MPAFLPVFPHFAAHVPEAAAWMLVGMYYIGALTLVTSGIRVAFFTGVALLLFAALI